MAIRGVKGAIASNFRGMTGNIGDCVRSSGPHAFLRGLKSTFITITKFFLGTYLMILTVIFDPILFMLTVIFITLIVTTVTTTVNKKTILCRVLPTIS